MRCPHFAPAHLGGLPARPGRLLHGAGTRLHRLLGARLHADGGGEGGLGGLLGRAQGGACGVFGALLQACS